MKWKTWLSKINFETNFVYRNLETIFLQKNDFVSKSPANYFFLSLENKQHSFFSADTANIFILFFIFL